MSLHTAKQARPAATPVRIVRPSGWRNSTASDPCMPAARSFTPRNAIRAATNPIVA